jgi:phosphate transport system substrate-binding protein
MIVPTTEAAPFSAAKGKSLSDYIFYFLCAGQQKSEQLGYAPLPKNLVEAAFAAVAQIPGASAAPAIGSCSNPTITGDFLVAKTTATTVAPGATTAPGATKPGATLAPGVTTTLVAGAEGTDTTLPLDGEIVDAAPVEGVTAIATPGIAMATSVEIDTQGNGTSVLIYLLIALLILGIVFAPPIVAGRLRPSVKQ